MITQLVERISDCVCLPSIEHLVRKQCVTNGQASGIDTH